ncbi:MAG TPA: hypothetical protein VEF53_17960, partial [Patescibacteria group bacterium]|nr:hypothetical protein [Patescibacteria group bacterium]
NDSITQLTSTSVATNTASPNLANEKYVSMKTIKVENGKVLLKDKLESGNYTALKTTALPKINDMVIDVTNALVKNVNDTDYVNVFYESEAVAPMAKIVLLDEKDSYKILSIGIAEEYMTMNLFDNRMSAKAIAYMHIDNFEKDEYSIYKRKVEDTIIAMFGETDGEKISEYVMSKYDEKRSPEVMKKGFASYAGKHETKIFGKVRVDWINDRWMPDSTIDVYFTINK